MGKRILLMNDDALILRSLSSLLQKEGYEVAQANNGASAIELVKEAMFDLVVTDVRMPGMNGLETIKELQNFQKEKGYSQSRFMVITGFAEDEAPQQAIDLQVTEFLVKPFDVSRFLQAVRDQLQEEEPHKFEIPAESFAGKMKPSTLSIPNLKDGAFHFEKVILLKDTNLMGNVYFSNFVLWQGELRELILISHPRFKEEMAKISHVKIITHSIYHRFLHEVTFGDILSITINAREIKKISLVLFFRYFLKANKTFVVVGEGWQRIAFVDMKTGRPLCIPYFIRELAEAMEERVSTMKDFVKR